MNGRKDDIVLYFGCWTEPGHYLFNEQGHRLYDSARGTLKCPLGNSLDRTFAPPFVNEREDVTALTHIHNWTVLSMWDRSVDKRPGCNASFVAPGKHDEAEMWERARRAYPFIVARLKAAPKDMTEREGHDD